MRLRMVGLRSWLGGGEGALQSAGALIAWALALYVATRGGVRPVPVLTALALVTLAVYLLGQGLSSMAPGFPDPTWIEWLRRTWWAPALVPAFWLLVTLAIWADESADHLILRRRRVLWITASVVLPLGAALAVTGSVTNLVNDWNGAQPGEIREPDLLPGFMRYIPPGPLFDAYQLYLVICAGWAAGNLLVLWRASTRGTSLRARFGWLFVSAVLFLLSGVQLTAAGRLFVNTGVPGYVFLIAGIVIMGWNVARYGALLAGEVVFADALAFGIALGAVVATYGAVLLALGPPEFSWYERVLPLLFLLATTHVMVVARRPVFDRLVYGALASELREQLRSLAARVVRQPDLITALADVRETVDGLVRALRVPNPEPTPMGASRSPTPTALPAQTSPGMGAALVGGASTALAKPTPAPAPAEFRLLVEGALRHLNDLPALSEHALLEHLTATTGMHSASLERAGRLRTELEAAMDHLRPPGPRPSPGAQGTLGGWLHFHILHEAYAEGRPNKQIMQRYQLSEGTFHRARRRALDALASDLYQRSGAARRSPPHP